MWSGLFILYGDHRYTHIRIPLTTLTVASASEYYDRVFIRWFIYIRTFRPTRTLASASKYYDRVTTRWFIYIRTFVSRDMPQVLWITYAVTHVSLYNRDGAARPYPA